MKRRGKEANINLLSIREREKKSERRGEREREKEREISGEHDNISESLRIFSCLYVAWHANVSYDRSFI